MADYAAEYHRVNRELILDPGDEPMHNAYLVATIIIGELLGRDWYKDRSFSFDNRQFFRGDPKDWHDVHINSMRTILLGECLFNLQRVPGFDQVLRQLKSEKTEPAVAELEVGMLLKQQGIPFRYVRPTGEKYFDYDVEMFHPNGAVCCADAKCKMEGGTYSEGAIIGSLREARRRNLNPLLPGVVFIKMPEDWHRGDAFRDLFTAAVRKFLRTTSRVVTVYGYSMAVIRLDKQRIKTTIIDCEVTNEQHRFDTDLDWTLTRRFPPIPAPFVWAQLLMLPPIYKHTKLGPLLFSGERFELDGTIPIPWAGQSP